MQRTTARGLVAGLFGAGVALPLGLAAVSATIPYSFSNGAIADAAHVNANFVALGEAIDANAGPVGQVITYLGNAAPANFVLMDGQTLDKQANPEFTALVDHLQALGLGSGNLGHVPDWNDDRVLAGSALDLSAATLEAGNHGGYATLSVSASGSASVAKGQFNDGTVTSSGGSFSAGALPSLSWPTYKVPAHSHNDGDLVAGIGSANSNIGTLAFDAVNRYAGAGGCATYVIEGNAIACHGRNHNTEIYGNTGNWGAASGSTPGYDTHRSGGSFSAGTLPSMTFPSHALSFTGNATGTVSATGTAALDLRRGYVKYALRYR